MNKADKQIKKFIDEYQKNSLKYTLENEKLEQKIKDLKITLNLNQNLLYEYLLKSVNSNEELKNLIYNTKKIWEETESLIEKKNFFEIKTARLQEIIEDTPTRIREDVNKLTLINNKTQEEINEKDKIIKKLKIELLKTRKNALFPHARTEVYVTDPTKANLEEGQELLSLKSIVSKIAPIHFKKLENYKNLKKDYEELKKMMNNLIEKSYSIYSKINPKKINLIRTAYDKEDLKDLFNSLEGYDINVDKKEEEDDEDEENKNIKRNLSDSEDEEDNNAKTKLKEKEKELEKLTEQYKNLKIDCQDYENKINIHKKRYKDIKTKIKSLKDSTNYD